MSTVPVVIDDGHLVNLLSFEDFHGLTAGHFAVDGDGRVQMKRRDGLVPPPLGLLRDFRLQEAMLHQPSVVTELGAERGR